MASKKKARKSRQKAWNDLTDRGKLRRISKSPYYSQYMKERRRVQRLTRRLISEGYMPTQETLPPIPKKLTPASIRAVQKRTARYIKDRSDFFDLTTGDVKKESKVKKRPTKREAVSQAREELARQQVAEQEGQYREQEDQDREQEEFERWRREQDRVQRERLEHDSELRRQLDEGEMIAESIEQLISDIEDTFSRDLSKYARQAWDKAIKVDRQALYRRLAEHPEVIDALKDSYYQDKSGDHFRPTVFNRFVEILQGDVLSAQQLRNVQDAYERRQALDVDIDQGIED